MDGDTREHAATTAWSYRPRMDVWETPEGYTIRADTPGAAAEDIRIDYDNGSLTVHATVAARQSSDVEYVTHEYGIGDFDREVVLNDSIDPDAITAEYDHGVLTIHLPKSEEARPRRIPVRATKGR